MSIESLFSLEGDGPQDLKSQLRGQSQSWLWLPESNCEEHHLWNACWLPSSKIPDASLDYFISSWVLAWGGVEALFPFYVRELMAERQMSLPDNSRKVERMALSFVGLSAYGTSMGWPAYIWPLSSWTAPEHQWPWKLSNLLCRSSSLLKSWEQGPFGASLVAQTVIDLPAKQEAQVHSLGWEDHLEEGMTIHSSILAWRISWTEEPGRLQSMGSQSWTYLSD